MFLKLPMAVRDLQAVRFTGEFQKKEYISEESAFEDT